MEPEEINRKNLSKVKEIIAPLPSYVSDYFVARRTNTTIRTRLSYAYDIRKFFYWLVDVVPNIQQDNLKNIQLDTINQLTSRDIEEYIDFLQTDEKNFNHDAGIYRKLSSLSSFFGYLCNRDLIDTNPCDKVIKPKKIKDKRIIKMSPDEVVRFLDCIEFGSPSFTPRQQAYLIHTRERDLAIATLLLGTGIRVSECVGLNLSDCDFNNCRITVRRKGGKIQNVPMSNEVIEALQKYLNIREKINANDDALFLSIQNARMSIQSVENMISKFASAAGTFYKITPHKLRKTYGTELYQETGDIYLVASALGHENINTTKEYYAEQNEEKLLEARNIVKLRNKSTTHHL